MTAGAPEESGSPAGRRRRRKVPARATPEKLRRAALDYVARYATSSANLRRVLMRRVARAAAAHGDDPEAGAAAVEEVIGRLGRLGLLDDGAYAEAAATSLRRRGESARGIRARLGRAGVERATLERALEAAGTEGEAEELTAAVAFARRRRLGPFRAGTDERAVRRDRDLAALVRRGFGLGVARRVVDADDPEAAESLAAAD